MEFPGKNTGVGSHSLLQGIFPTRGSNLSLLHCRQILYHQSHREAQEMYMVMPKAQLLCTLVPDQNSETKIGVK